MDQFNPSIQFTCLHTPGRVEVGCATIVSGYPCKYVLVAVHFFDLCVCAARIFLKTFIQSSNMAEKTRGLFAQSLGEGRIASHRLKVLVLTFLSYMCFHASRIPPSVTKGVLHPHSESAATQGSYDPQNNPGWMPFSQDLVPSIVGESGYLVENSNLCSLAKAGVFQCTRMEIAKKESRQRGFGNWCKRYTSSNFKFSLELNHANEGKNKCGVVNSTNCWSIDGIKENLTKNERQRFCDGTHCVLYVQNGGFHLPAEVDSQLVKWISKKSVYGSPPDVMPYVTNGKILLGSMMTVYLLAYAGGMFVSGHVADQISLRHFLAFGMFGSGILVCLIGGAKAFDQHNLVYFYSIYAVQGIFQSIGWPTVVAIMGNWFSKNSRGFVMTVWNSHTSVGNMVGKALSSFALGLRGGSGEDDGNNWPATFFVCGGLIMTMSIFIFCCLHNSPAEAGVEMDETEEDLRSGNLLDSTSKKDHGDYGTVSTEEETPEPGDHGGIMRALVIPGVVENALALFFCKFVAYTFIYWLPYYLGHIGFPAETAGYLSIFFDLGGIPGGIFAGVISDRLRTRGIVIFAYLFFTIPALYVYRVVTASLGAEQMYLHVMLMLVLGALVNGPYALITTAVSADLGQHKSLKGSKGLMATVAGIIDGTGSIGAAAQGVVIGVLSSSCKGWDSVFSALQIACGLSAICLARSLLWPTMGGWKKDQVHGFTRVILFFAVLGILVSIVYYITLIVSYCGAHSVTCT